MYYRCDKSIAPSIINRALATTWGGRPPIAFHGPDMPFWSVQHLLAIQNTQSGANRPGWKKILGMRLARPGSNFLLGGGLWVQTNWLANLHLDRQRGEQQNPYVDFVWQLTALFGAGFGENPQSPTIVSNGLKRGKKIGDTASNVIHVLYMLHIHITYILYVIYVM